MKLRHELSPQKLRGGYYTPPKLVDFCVAQAQRLAKRPLVEWLEPSAGDGAFVRALSHQADARITCVEVDPIEASKCRLAMSEPLWGEVVEGSFFPWIARAEGRSFDAVIGNPPYVRYQLLSADDRRSAEQIAGRFGLEIHGVSNAWILFALISMKIVRPGGVFVMVLPSELLATVSAGQFRKSIIEDYTSIQLDMFARDTFSHLLQDVVVVSGRRAAKTAEHRTVTFIEHRKKAVRWAWTVDSSFEPWMRHLLTAREREALEKAQQIPTIRKLGDIARLQVSVVTGANSYFTIPDNIATQYDLYPWAVPMLPKTIHAPGLQFTKQDFAATRASGARAWLLDFGADRPELSKTAQKYLQLGESDGIPDRYKCRVRSPWYRVPHIVTGSLMLTKRAHQHHRLLVNSAGVATTDTVYRGEPTNGYKAQDIVAGFHNSLTLLSAELEGRTYGGGVLELVPSEISRLLVPMINGLGSHLPTLDEISRCTGGQKDDSDRLADATDEIVASAIPPFRMIFDDLRDARIRLRQRRFDGT